MDMDLNNRFEFKCFSSSYEYGYIFQFKSTYGKLFESQYL